jgi:hypothetical protein
VAKILTIVLTIVLVFFSCSRERKDKDEQIVTDSPDKMQSFDSFLFVGLISQNPGLYKYDVKAKKYSIFWSDKKEKVIVLSYSDDRENAFFLTAREFSNLPESGLPFINKVKAYLLNTETGRVTFIENIGSGLQVFASWEDNNTFKVMLNSVDKVISNYIQQRTRLYNIFGKRLQDFTETYDITRQGYPLPKGREIKFVSPNGKYSVNYGKDSLSIYLQDSEEEQQILIIKTGDYLEQIEWGNSFLFFSIRNFDPERNENLNLSKLFIYSFDKKRILKTWEGVGYFIVVNNFIVFDSGSGEEAYITIYDYVTGESSDKIIINHVE